MIIVVEGVDGSGKTTFTENLKKVLHFPSLKMPKDIENFNKPEILNAISENFDRVIEQLSRTKYDFIVDRAFLSGFVYTELFERSLDTSYIDDILTNSQNQILLVVLTGDHNIFVERKKDKVIQPEMIKKINDLYVKYGKKYGAIFIDSSKLSPNECIDSFLDQI